MEHLEGCGCLFWCLLWCGVRVGPILDTRKSDWNCKTVMVDCEMCLQEPGLKFSLWVMLGVSAVEVVLGENWLRTGLNCSSGAVA